jgi:organic hydroperoxide reductase OsmC/OhrA
MTREHSYSINVSWTGNTGTGTSNFREYKRDHEISASGKPSITGSSDPTFRGDKARYNPEELLVASLSACHMLWYLHLCSDAGIVVVEYHDDATGVMVETEGGGGHFTNVTLRPVVKVSGAVDQELARRLHEQAHHLCFIANSVNFPVLCEPTIDVGH